MLCCSWIPLETLNGSIQIARREKSISYATFLKYEYLSLNYFCLLKFIKFQKQNRQNQKQDFQFSILAFLINTSTLLILSSFFISLIFSHPCSTSFFKLSLQSTALSIVYHLLLSPNFSYSTFFLHFLLYFLTLLPLLTFYVHFLSALYQFVNIDILQLNQSILNK